MIGRIVQFIKGLKVRFCFMKTIRCRASKMVADIRQVTRLKTSYFQSVQLILLLLTYCKNPDFG
ncbi:MAG: hypothetical protein CVV31_11475 [Methanomicrobiales archaeon HGW-Methanomicrobiales-2]|nr:MAG: hypothetical protein CVV31_11475 [Methanomicrobiales archaeon HGW-Methanomicrobiales-2]